MQIGECTAGASRHQAIQLLRQRHCWAGLLRQLVAECLACRAPEIVAIGVKLLAAHEGVWNCKRVLQEALSAGQDPDCRGNVCSRAAWPQTRPACMLKWQLVGPCDVARMHVAGLLQLEDDSSCVV